MIWLVFLGGMGVGCFIGIFFAGLLYSGKEDDEK